MNKLIKDLLTIIFFTLFITFLIWVPHFLKINLFNLDFSAGFATIYRNFDGLEYIVIAKTWYNPSSIAAMPQSLPANYYAAHFPGYSVLIWLAAPFLGYLKSMVFISLIFTIFSALAFYFLVKDFKLTNHPLLLSLIFLILPARWLIVHSVGSAEPVFIFFTICTFYFLLKYEHFKNYYFLILSALFGLLAQVTRPPGILLFGAIGLYILYMSFLRMQESKKQIKSELILLMRQSLFPSEIGSLIKSGMTYLPFLLIPLTLLGVFYLYSLSYQDFWAYFHSGDNIHLAFPPFQAFNKSQFWVGEIWLEDIIYIFILGALGGFYLWKQKLYPLAFFVLTYLGASMFVAHRDISRYILPIFPFCLIAFEKVLTSKEFKIVLIILALAIYLYAQNFILKNTAPIPNLNVFN